MKLILIKKRLDDKYNGITHAAYDGFNSKTYLEKPRAYTQFMCVQGTCNTITKKPGKLPGFFVIWYCSFIVPKR